MAGHQEISIFLLEILQPSKIIISVPLVALIPTLRLNELSHVVKYYMVGICSFSRVYMTAITCKLRKWKSSVQLPKKTIRVWPALPERSNRATARPRARIARQTRTRRRRAGTRRACRARRTRCLCPEAPRRRRATARSGMRMWRACRRVSSAIPERTTASSGARRARTARSGCIR
jgi:hypothetical protein